MNKQLPTFIICLLFYFPLISQLSFTEQTDHEIEPIYEGESAFADVDGDGDLDYFHVGYQDGFNALTELYLNDGAGNYTKSPQEFPGLGYSGMTFQDMDGDEDIDLIIFGQGAGGDLTFIYLNDGEGTFKLLPDTPVQGVNRGHASFGDVDNDGDVDLMFQGLKNFAGTVTELYFNDGSANFTPSTENSFESAYQGESDFGDLDGDGDLDMIIVGSLTTGDGTTRLFRNLGSGVFTEIEDHGFVGLNIATVDMEDVDMDGDIDVLMTGMGPNGLTTELYLNDGSAQFAKDQSSSLVDIIFGSCDFGDVDLDGDPDLLIAGRDGAIPSETAKVYLNDGNGNFSLLTGSTFTGAVAGAARLGDIDGDGDLDAIISGRAPDDVVYTKIYINNLMVSADDSVEEELFSVFPNPFNDRINIKGNYTQLEYELRNILGHLIVDGTSHFADQVQIPTAQLPAGIYLLHLKDNQGGEDIVKLIKE